MKALIILVLALSGCATAHSARIAVLQNPETKQTVECKVNHMSGNMNFKRQIDDCVATYQKAGYKLVADSHDL